MRTLLGIGLLLLVTACKKMGPDYIEGTVYEAGTGVPIPNVYVRLKKHTPEFTNNEFRTATTDANGYFKIKYNYKSRPDYRLDIISGEHVSVLNRHIDDKKMPVFVWLEPHAYVKIRVKSNLSYKANVYISMESYNKRYFNNYIYAGSDSLYKDIFHVALNDTVTISGYYSSAPPDLQQPVNFSGKIFVSNKFDTLVHTITIK